MVDAFIITLAVVILLAFARWPHPVRPVTAFLLVLLTVGWLCANLRTTGWREEMGGVKPATGLDPITEAMFWRGWPLSPFMFCVIHGMKFHPTGFEPLVLTFNLLVFVVALTLAKAAIYFAKVVSRRR